MLRLLIASGRVSSPCPVISPLPWIQDHYENMRCAGQSHRLAEMLAMRQSPRIMTDSVFLQGHCNGNQFAGMPYQGDYYRGVAQRQGQDTTGKVYLSGLAAYPGDPEAWVSGRGDAERICQKRGWGAQGAISVKALPREPGPPVRLADDLVDGIAGPGATAEEKANVVERHGRPA